MKVGEVGMKLKVEIQDLRRRIKEQDSVIEALKSDLNETLKVLGEQEPKTGHWIFESRYCEAWSHTCSECGKRMTTAVGMYASFCWNCGAKMTGGDLSSSEIPNS